MFLCFADESVTPRLLEQLGDLVDQFERFDFHDAPLGAPDHL